MDDDDPPLLTIGQLAQRAGLAVRTIRFWSDAGLVTPAARTGSGRRLHDAACAARLELVAALRELGLGVPEVRRVVENRASVPEVAAAHVAALDAQIRTLRARRAVLAAAARRAAGAQEMTLMNKLARLSAAQRARIIDEFVTEVFDGLGPEPALAAGLRAAPDLPDDPAPEQVDAWVELAELVQDQDFRQRVRAMAVHGAPGAGGLAGGGDAASADFAARVADIAGAARERGVSPGSGEAGEALEAVLAGVDGARDRSRLADELEVFTDDRVERYWQLVGAVNGWPPVPPRVPAFEWLVAALRAHS